MKRLMLILGAVLAATAASAQSVLEATLAEPDQKTQEVSTLQLRQILADGSAVLLDARPRREYAVSHIPGAVNVAPRPGLPPHLYVSDVAEVGRMVEARDRPLVLYCNGPSCGKSRRLAAELLAAGFTDVRRYQLGAPGWRAFGGAMRTLPEALHYLSADRTAVWVDAREAAVFARGTLPGARNIPRSGLRPGKDQGVMREAKDDGRLPMEDHNTRVIVFGAGGNDARAVAEAIAGEAFHNVSFLAEPFDEVRRAMN
jgi:rhodanese-related sulfurtransferase